MSRYIKDAFLNGTTQVIRDYANITVKNLDSNVSAQSLSNTLGATINNSVVEVSTQTGADIILTNAVSFSGRAGVDIKIYDMDYSYIVGNSYGMNTTKVNLILVTDQNKYYNSIGNIEFKNGEVHLLINGFINDSHTNYQSFNLKSIQVIGRIHTTFDTLMC